MGMINMIYYPVKNSSNHKTLSIDFLSVLWYNEGMGSVILNLI